MQPEASESSTTLLDLSVQQPPQQPFEYGFRPPVNRPGHEQPGGLSAGLAAAPALGGQGVPDELPRSNGVVDGEPRPRRPYNAVAEYERAFMPRSPRKVVEGPAFKVVQSKSNRRNGPKLDKFPNEVLTLILSHLSANSFSTVSLVSRRFYDLVTTPHAWRVAFSRYFPGQDAEEEERPGSEDIRDTIRAEQRFFTRLTALSSWRSEYIMRTRLLRSLSRGKPQAIAMGFGASLRPNAAAKNTNSTITYDSHLNATINHLHAAWKDGKKSPCFVHGTDEMGHATISDANIGHIDEWGHSDPVLHRQFADLYLGEQSYGLGDGSIVGVPNVMDVSLPYGMVYGEGFPGGLTYFRHSNERRRRPLTPSTDMANHPAELPKIPSTSEAVTAVWIAKTPAIPSMTEGLVGLMVGTSCGIVTTYSLGADNIDRHRLAQGEVTARWVLSPGVPIIAIKVDDSYNEKRKAAGRIWAVALNALGEVFYLTQAIQQVSIDKSAILDEDDLVKLAWETGRNVAWKLAEPTRRAARGDSYQAGDSDGTYSPSSSSKSSHLSKDQLLAENREIETFLKYRPAHFQKVCEGWDMRRRLEVDFAGDDGHGAGESAVVIKCGTPESGPAQIKRYTRIRSEESSFDQYPVPRTPPVAPKAAPVASLFGGGKPAAPTATVSPAQEPISMSPAHPYAKRSLAEEWRTTNLAWQGSQMTELTTSAIDTSTYALLTAAEDPILAMNGGSTATSSASSTPKHSDKSLSDIPGYRGRFIAVGTKTGVIYVWDMRGAQSSNPAITNTLEPVRAIYTDSPQISCLAVSALYLAHGGNDGLVQAWDTLASSMQPIRTLNSRFSSRARRRIAQAEASIYGVGINLFAAGAIALDPDPTSLRGMVSLGTHLKYWAYSSTAADEVSSKKRRMRPSIERGLHGATDRYMSTGRGALTEHIVNEQRELVEDEARREKEQAHLHGRFGVGLAGLDDNEALQYAELISQEAFQREEERKLVEAADAAARAASAAAALDEPGLSVPAEPSASATAAAPPAKTEGELEDDIEKAIRLSLMESEPSYAPPPAEDSHALPFVVKQKKGKSSASASASPHKTSGVQSWNDGEGEWDDLDFALQLSLAEEQTRGQAGDGLAGDGQFPALDEGWKGKGRADW